MCIGVLPACFVCVRMSDPFKLELKTDMWMLGIELSPEEHPVLLSAEPSLQPQHSLRDSGVQSGSLQPHARRHPPASWGSRLHLLSQCPPVPSRPVSQASPPVGLSLAVPGLPFRSLIPVIFCPTPKGRGLLQDAFRSFTLYTHLVRTEAACLPFASRKGQRLQTSLPFVNLRRPGFD